MVADYAVWRCAGCCYDFVYPHPAPEALAACHDRCGKFGSGEPGGFQDCELQSSWSLDLARRALESFPADSSSRSVLDLGCAYGNHLALAHAKGWKCFGVEPSKHARAIAAERLARGAFIVETVGDLVPHAYDLLLMLDVLEHIADPLALFHELFSQGAITPATRVIVSTPNARSTAAVADPCGWQFRHPPSHLGYFSAEALSRLFTRLRFQTLEIEGAHEGDTGGPGAYADETSELNRRNARYQGLVCTATGSDFTEFMRERYVPGTWSALARYEHMPRYQLAAGRMAGRRVLDFGCGTGYGTALLAAAALEATGLDIDADAVSWAQKSHAAPNLRYERRDDLGAGIPPGSYDVVTCFEMIEHVDAETQGRVIDEFRRILAADGLLVISTPNPAVTGTYGANPFHKREMDGDEFFALLKSRFAHVRLLCQHIYQAVTFAEMDPGTRGGISGWEPMLEESGSSGEAAVPPIAFVALCSQAPLAPLAEGRVTYPDVATDPVREFLERRRKLWQSQMEHYRAQEEAARLREQAARDRALIAEHEAILGQLTVRVAVRLTSFLSRFRVLRLAIAALRAAAARLDAGTLQPRLRRACRPRQDAPSALAYQVRASAPVADAPLVLHAIANMMTGGSSRLVVDLIERLGETYAHAVLTSLSPDPPAYQGIDITELRGLPAVRKLDDYLARRRPALVHLHYWGECDRAWYERVAAAAERSGVPILENVNTPVMPLASPGVRRFVFVSEYVRRAFGHGGPDESVVYPGSDFQLFAGDPREAAARDSVGMVYRLEADKLDPRAIDPFIALSRLRPSTRVYIVGGGSYLKPFRAAVAHAGLEDRFEFTGYVPYETLPDWYRRFGVFIAPVFKESFGQVSPFAMSMGIPVVGYDTGAIAEIIGDPRLVAPTGRAEELAAIAADLLGDAQRRLAEGRRQQERAHRHFSLEAMIAAYRELYRDLTRGGGPCA